MTDPQTPVWHSTDAKAIQDQLNAKGVRFERWQADRDLGANPSPETVIAAYQHAIDKLVAERATKAGTSSACAPITRKRGAAGKVPERAHPWRRRGPVLSRGGLFCLHIGDEVFQVLCERTI